MNRNRLSEGICALVGLMDKLRGPDGCPWDAKQNDLTIKAYLLEEAYEAVEAVEKVSPEHVCEELGDLLFQIIFLSRLADERNEFDFADVLEKINEKMIRRHPHVFGDVKVNSETEVLANWVRIKKEEKNNSFSTESLLNEVSGNLPALMRAHRLGERASKVSFDWKGPFEVWKKVREEISELEEAMDGQNMDLVGEELGDVLFSLCNLARHLGFNGEHLLRSANNKFVARFEKMENQLRESGISLDEASPEQMDRAWELIKQS